MHYLKTIWCMQTSRLPNIPQLLLCMEHKLASSLPLNQLWSSLIGASCQLTAEKRLKVVALLLQVLHLSSSSREVEEESKYFIVFFKAVFFFSNLFCLTTLFLCSLSLLTNVCRCDGPSCAESGPDVAQVFVAALHRHVSQSRYCNRGKLGTAYDSVI